jgi:anaerobic magnesium-protoporphyrin IX monomethyl ester cyclase
MSDVIFIAFPKSDEIRKGKDSIPVGILYLNEYLRRRGFDSDILDYSILQQSEKLPYAPLYGLNCFSSYQFPAVVAMAKKIKRIYPESKVSVGGSHPTFFAMEILANVPEIDYVVIGEGETQMLDLVCGSDPQFIQSLAYRYFGFIITVGRKNYLERLNISPEVLWEPIDFKKYYSDHSFWNNPKKQDINLAVPIVSSRSCPFHCEFCSAQKIMGNKIRLRDPENVLDEIEYLVQKRGQNYFEFVDDNINVNKKHAMDIFGGIIDRKLNIQFSLASGIHLQSADESLIRIMAGAGLSMIKLPIEHGNDHIRNDIIGKHLEIDKVREITRILKEYKIFVFGLFIMGFPEDTPETLDDSLALQRELALDQYDTASLTPFPGTRLFEQCVRDNLLVDNLNPSDFWKGTIAFDASEHDKIYIKPYNMTIEQLKEYRKKFDAIRIGGKE